MLWSKARENKRQENLSFLNAAGKILSKSME